MFTRSRSQIYLHRSRSGRGRSGSFPRIKFHAELRSNSAGISSDTSNKKVKAEVSDSTEMDDWSNILIKDLRIRRVFSPHLPPTDSGFCVGIEEENKSEKKKQVTEEGFCSDSSRIESLNSVSLIDKEGMAEKCLNRREVGEKEIDLGFCSLEQNNTDLRVDEGNAGSCLDGEIYAEGCVQATRPDALIFQKLTIASDNQRAKSVLSSRSRVKVFKVPYSFSYRRLLPYLMGMEQDNSSTATKGNCTNVENQPLTVGHDTQIFADELPAQHIVDSASLVPTQKDSSTILSSPTSLDDELCSKHIFGSLNENIQIGIPSKHEILECSIPDCIPELHNPHNNGDFNESKPLNGEDDEARQGSCCTTQDDKTNVKKEQGSDDFTDTIYYWNEEHNRMTPQDVDIFGSPADKRIKYILKNTDQVPKRPVNESFPHNDGYFADKKGDSSSKRKLGLSPCSQLKLFKTESSLNYRRLLPFLMDITKVNSGDSRNFHSLKLQKSMKENVVSPLSMSVNETPAQKLNSISTHLEKSNNSCIIQMAEEANNIVSGCTQSSSASSDYRTEFPKSVALENDPELKVIHLISDDKRQELAPGSSADTMTIAPTVVGPCSVDVPDPVLHKISANNEDNCKKSKMAIINAASPVEPGNSDLSQNSCKLEAPGPSVIAANGSRKGILKISPRGCRGPCNCLNCASFYLNAERAFEFSKNQMQDAEEVVLELIEELSHLQNMLGGAASACTDNVVIHIDQMKEACMRACEAQELAKSRLALMNYDLNIHCRTPDGQRPRVKFANNVEQRMISNVGPSKIQQ